MNRRIDFEAISIGHTRNQWGVTLTARLKVTTPDRNPVSVSVQVEAQLQNLPSETTDIDQQAFELQRYVLQLLRERFGGSLPEPGAPTT